MSAEKCGQGTVSGDVLQKELQKAIDAADLGDVVRPLVLTAVTYRLLKKIRHKFPDFDPANESAIFIKARNMGITEEE